MVKRARKKRNVLGKPVFAEHTIASRDIETVHKLEQSLLRVKSCEVLLPVFTALWKAFLTRCVRYEQLTSYLAIGNRYTGFPAPISLQECLTDIDQLKHEIHELAGWITHTIPDDIYLPILYGENCEFTYPIAQQS